jgi:hypothetical protein
VVGRFAHLEVAHFAVGFGFGFFLASVWLSVFSSRLGQRARPVVD